MKVIKAGVISLIISLILIYCFENGKSFFQILTGFLIFIFPVTFINIYLKSRVLIFFLVFSFTIFNYIIYKNDFQDFYFGTVLSLILGLYINFEWITKNKK